MTCKCWHFGKCPSSLTLSCGGPVAVAGRDFFDDVGFDFPKGFAVNMEVRPKTGTQIWVIKKNCSITVLSHVWNLRPWPPKNHHESSFPQLQPFLLSTILNTYWILLVLPRLALQYSSSQFQIIFSSSRTLALQPHHFPSLLCTIPLGMGKRFTCFWYAAVFVPVSPFALTAVPFLAFAKLPLESTIFLARVQILVLWSFCWS